MAPLPHTTLPLLTTLPQLRSPRLRMPRARLLDLSPLLFPMVESRPPPTPLTTTTDSLLLSPMKVLLSPPQSPPLDTDTPPLLMPLPQHTGLLKTVQNTNLFIDIYSNKFENSKK